jgi:hypothetical protein
MQHDVTSREEWLNPLRKTAWQRPFGKGFS